ncbi:MAG: hypothetical protein AAGD25_01210 [Cyanobacteria bacterium P01_F01_bin.150]
MRLTQDLAATGSFWACDVMNDVVCNGKDKWAQYWQWGCDEPESFFRQYGWQAQAIQPGEEGACFDRHTFQFAPREEKEEMHIFFVTAFKSK